MALSQEGLTLREGDVRREQTNPPPVGNQKTSRVRNPKTQRSGNAEVGRTFGDTVHIGTWTRGQSRRAEREIDLTKEAQRRRFKSCRSVSEEVARPQTMDRAG